MGRPIKIKKSGRRGVYSNDTVVAMPKGGYRF